ncbi:MAG: glycosyltransferase [Anaerolineales bacterium]|nr:glycosyltransferase [Anaerolineales bacterium]
MLLKPLISIIIPCHNSQSYIEQSITSSFNQTYPTTEIIVIDDGSTDNSLDIIRSFSERIRWESSLNRGAPAARNRGLELAKGKFIKFLDADDVLLPDCVERQVAQALALSEESKAIIYGDALWIDSQGQSLPGYAHRPRRAGEDPIAHILANSPLTTCPLHRRDYLLDIGGFDPSIPKGQEHDLHLRLALAGIEFVYRPGPVYHYREHSDPQRISNHQLSRKNPLVHFDILQKQRHLIEAKNGDTPTVRRVLAQRFWAYGRGILREGYVKEAEQYFSGARALDAKHCITGNTPYPLLARLFGPQWAESCLGGVRRLLRA